MILKKIIIVEDDLIQDLFLKKAVSHLGYEMIGSTTMGKLAIEMATELKPDIILMDINLGGELNGIQTANHILKEMDCFVVFITGNSDEKLIKKARETPKSALLIKPITGDNLENAIRSYFNDLI